jgi:hypothetical protein
LHTYYIQYFYYYHSAIGEAPILECFPIRFYRSSLTIDNPFKTGPRIFHLVKR